MSYKYRWLKDNVFLQSYFATHAVDSSWALNDSLGSGSLIQAAQDTKHISPLHPDAGVCRFAAGRAPDGAHPIKCHAAVTLFRLLGGSEKYVVVGRI